jgi:hypothetical protein
MKNNILFPFFFFFSITSVNAQPDLRWAKQMGATQDDFAVDIALDSDGNSYTTGWFSGSADFDPDVGYFNLTSKSYYSDVFISKLDSLGNFVWARQFGGSGPDIAASLATDPFGNIIVVGKFSDTVDFDPGIGSFNLTAAPNVEDIFICKFDFNGNFVWAKQISGSGTNYKEANSVGVDALGNIVTTGYFSGVVDFDPGNNGFNLSSNNYDVFVCKLDSNGNLIWVKQMGGANYDEGRSVAVDVNGNIYTTGYYGYTADFDPGTGVFNLTAIDWGDIFISKLDALGNFVWARSIGGHNLLYGDMGSSIIVDAHSNVYTTGYFEDTADFDPGIGIYKLITTGFRDVFISKLNSSGDFVWAKSFGGNDYDGDTGNDISLDTDGNIYALGSFCSTVDFDPGTSIHNLSTGSREDIFISKLDSFGNFKWAGKIGGGSGGLNHGYSLILNAQGQIYCTGTFEQTTDFDPGSGVSNITSFGGRDIFVCKLGNQVLIGVDEDNPFENPFTVFPNPFIETCTVTFKNSVVNKSVCIYNSLGQCVINKLSTKNCKLEIDLSTQSKGIYFMEILSGEKRSVNKIVLQ